MGTSSPSACFFLESRDRIQPLRAWGEPPGLPFSPPCRPCVELGPLGGMGSVVPEEGAREQPCLGWA